MEYRNDVPEIAREIQGEPADPRLKGFDNVPTLKERGIDVSIGTCRGPAECVQRNAPAV